jgi:hypothetical protein
MVAASTEVCSISEHIQWVHTLTLLCDFRYWRNLVLMRRTWWVLVTKVHPQEARGGIVLPPVTSLLLLFPLLLLQGDSLH